ARHPRPARPLPGPRTRTDRPRAGRFGLAAVFSFPLPPGERVIALTPTACTADQGHLEIRGAAGREGMEWGTGPLRPYADEGTADQPLSSPLRLRSPWWRRLKSPRSITPSSLRSMRR